MTEKFRGAAFLRCCILASQSLAFLLGQGHEQRTSLQHRDQDTAEGGHTGDAQGVFPMQVVGVMGSGQVAGVLGDL